MLNGKKILFATGGTGGHINPALAAAGEIRERFPDAEILFIGTKDKMEAKLVPAAGFKFKTIEISGFYRQTCDLLQFFLCLPQTSFQRIQFLFQLACLFIQLLNVKHRVVTALLNFLHILRT